MTGWGRTGKLFAMDHCNEKPDIVCLSKGLTGGVLPLGLTVTTNDIYHAFLSDDKTKALLHGHSFTGNPLSCAAANASIAILKSKKCQIQIEQISVFNLQFKEELQSLFPELTVRCLGTILAIELPSAENGYFSDIRDLAYNYFLEKGLLIRPLGNVIFINPPYCITNKQLNKIKKGINGFINKFNSLSD